MGSQFHNITRDEMAEFLEGQGFSTIQPQGVTELVWRKRFEHDGMHLSLWVFTGIVPSGNSRGVGEDAIRLNVMWWDGEKPVRIGGSKRVHRIKTWRKNLQERISNWLDMLGPKCPKCGKPTVLKEPKPGQTWKPFYGCVGWKPRNEGCSGLVKIDGSEATPPRPKAVQAPPKRSNRRPYGMSRSAMAAEAEWMHIESMQQ